MRRRPRGFFGAWHNDSNASSIVRVVLVHGWAPPTRGGTSIIVERLLGRMDGVVLTTWTRLTQRSRVRKGNSALPGTYRYFVQLRSSLFVPRGFSFVITIVNVVLAVLTGACIGIAAGRKSNSVVISVVDDGFSQIAGGVAARIARAPHVIWVFDLWEENAYAASDRVIARWAERGLWRSAAAIVVHAEEMVEHYQTKHGVLSHVFRTPIDESQTAVAVRTPDDDVGQWEVLVAGAVYWAQVEALRRVAAAVRSIPWASFTVVGDPALQTATLDAAVYEPPVYGRALQERMARAQLLVLGLSFNTQYADVVRTATPARLPEYLVSGVPVLVHAPSSSHVARHVRRWELGTVVDDPTESAVRQAIEEIRTKAGEHGRQAAYAREFVLKTHGAINVRQDFRTLLGVVATRERAK